MIVSHESHRRHFSPFNVYNWHSSYIGQHTVMRKLDKTVQYSNIAKSLEKGLEIIHKKVREAEEEVRFPKVPSKVPCKREESENNFNVPHVGCQNIER